MLTLDVMALPRRHEDLAAALCDALLRQRVVDAGLQLVGIDKLLDGEGRLASEALAGARILRQARRPIFIDCESSGQLVDALRDTHVISVRVPELPRWPLDRVASRAHNVPHGGIATSGRGRSERFCADLESKSAAPPRR